VTFLLNSLYLLSYTNSIIPLEKRALRPFNATGKKHTLLGQHERVSGIFINFQPNIYSVDRFSKQSQP